MPSRKPGRHAFTFVLITVLIDMVGIGLILPVLPTLIEDLAGVNVSGATMIGGWLFVAYSAMQFLFGPLIGNLSDAYGRRPVLLLSVAGLGFDYLLTAFAPTVGWLFLGRLVAGICGASYTTANAFIADITEPAERAKAFGMIGAAFGVGFVIGPAIGGVLGGFGDRVPFLAAAALSLANLAYGWVVLPETLPRDRRRRFCLKRANPLGTLVAFRHYPALVALGGVVFLHFLATNVYPAIWAYYMIYRLHWNTLEIGLSLAAFGLITAAVQAGLVGPAIKRFGERAAAGASLLVEVTMAVGYAFVTSSWMVYALLVFGGLQGVAMPAINALMSHQVDEDAQGELQGGISSLMGIASILGPALATQLFALFTGGRGPIELPGAPFLAAAFLSLIALGVFLRAPVRGMKRH